MGAASRSALHCGGGEWGCVRVAALGRKSDDLSARPRGRRSGELRLRFRPAESAWDWLIPLFAARAGFAVASLSCAKAGVNRPAMRMARVASRQVVFMGRRAGLWLLPQIVSITISLFSSHKQVFDIEISFQYQSSSIRNRREGVNRFSARRKQAARWKRR